MEKNPRLSAELRADLVAYLDGELDEARVKEIEQTLGKSPVARHDVDILARTWELLEELPRATTTSEFTAKTLSSIRVDEMPRQWVRPGLVEAMRSSRFRRGVILATWVAGLSLVAVVGFLAANRWVPSDHRMLAGELPVIENLDIYKNAGSIEFLEELKSKVGSFDDGKSHPSR